MKKKQIFRGGASLCSFLFVLTIFGSQVAYDAVYGEKVVEDIDNTIYCLIRSLRKKLEADPRHPEYILTVRGAGYKFVVLGE